MSASRPSLEPAWVIHRRPYRDTSLLLDLFTQDYGRVALVARSARSARSRTRGLLQPFRPLLVSWSGRGELGTLTAVEPDRPAPRLPGDRLMAGFYVNELVLRLLERHDPQGDLFADYGAVVEAIAAAADDAALAAALRLFEKRLLEALGYGLNLTHEAMSGRAVHADGHYHYEHENGPVPAGVAEGGRPVISGAALLALAAESLHDAAHVRAWRPLLREAIERHLGGRRLQTGDVARAAARRGGGATGAPAAAVPGREHAGNGAVAPGGASSVPRNDPTAPVAPPPATVPVDPAAVPASSRPGDAG